MADIETMNDQLVAARGSLVAVMRPKPLMTPDEALRHAAWLVSVAEVQGATHTFDEVLAAIRET